MFLLLLSLFSIVRMHAIEYLIYFSSTTFFLQTVEVIFSFPKAEGFKLFVCVCEERRKSGKWHCNFSEKNLYSFYILIGHLTFVVSISHFDCLHFRALSFSIVLFLQI